jgi:hypothetical protein
MATASIYVALRCGDGDAAAGDGAGAAGVAAVVVAVVDVVFGVLEDFDFKVWRSFAKARRK